MMSVLGTTRHSSPMSVLKLGNKVILYCILLSTMFIHLHTLNLRAQELYESRGGRPGLSVPNSAYGLCGRIQIQTSSNVALRPQKIKTMATTAAIREAWI